ncbi:exodeoxyribonuclease VII large subunit [Tissierella sp.]|uniref:exodeoxyribonuclease VII large subunit n=1 Tax=Tissierella sp. TaxID=41274 RepID=UPI0028568E42|nr:exodeoxyribonuclease VII large subunit [Tissierella sp.]MDR7856149.1 exodeoxyribonuclease VII large subunit [Tissierella sp.]
MDIRALKVSELNNYIKRVFLTDMILSNISVEGEVSNFKYHYSGHMYFNLKDEKGKIKAVMFKGDAESLNFNMENGKKVIATGYVSVYEKEGDYQLYVRYLKESGIGDLYKAFEQLKNKLEEEGLFLESIKKPIPYMPKKIGVVTSSTGAAIKDIITVLHRRFPPCDILIYPSLVQGEQAPKEICQGLRYLDNREDVELIIFGRGGGSIEELYAFNDEEVARTIYGLNTPVISAVGHETDFTIADFVADLRAPTPSAAAELAVPDINHLRNEIENKYNRLVELINKNMKDYNMRLKYLSSNLKFYNPINQIKDKKQEMDSILKEVIYYFERYVGDNKSKLMELKNRLNLLNPLIGLDNGHCLIINDEGNLIKSVNEVKLDEKISLLLKDGKIVSSINKIEKGELISGD